MTHARINHELLDPHRGTNTLLFTSHEAPGEGVADYYKEWDETVCRAIGRLLHGEYRGHDWQVWVSRQAGIAKTWLNCLMNPAFPYVSNFATNASSTVTATFDNSATSHIVAASFR